MMKKLFVLTIAVAAFTGCGRGWLPLYQGAPCNNCPPAAPTACNDCGVTSGYAPYGATYEGGIVDDYYTGPVYNEPMVDVQPGA